MAFEQPVFCMSPRPFTLFTVKIRNLHDYQLRVLHGIMPVPTGVDIANTIKYFSQTLLTVLKDVPNFPLELLKNPEMDATRMALFPNLDYKGLYNALVPLIEVAPLVQNGLEAFGQAILQCLGCLLPFLENDLINHLPYLTASSIAVLPSTLHQDIVNYLCFYILPFTITRHDKEDENSITHSVATVIMMVFQYSTNPAHHCQLLECLMTLKQTILKDLLCVIAYGSSSAKSSCAKLLFYYWPPFNANLFDRKGLICKFAGDPSPFVCQRDLCPNSGNAEAAKVCYDHCISITFASDSPPPLYLCIECANEIHREHPNQQFFDILHPMQQVSMVCENKNCRAIDKSAVSICFSTECASYNGNHPIRYCQQCHSNRHNNRRGNDHIVHKSLPPTWTMDTEMQTYMVEAIVSLLKEAKTTSVSEVKESVTIEAKSTVPDNISIEERQLLGRYGVWLLVGRCSPSEETPIEILGRLLAMLFHWFHVTAYSYDGNTYIHTYLHYATFPFLGSPFLMTGQDEGSLEKLKTEYVCSWLQGIRNTHYNLFLSCLLPHPPEYARVGGHWDTLASRTSHLKDGLHRLFCLVPYEIITSEIWDHIMPFWMEAVVNDVPEKELHELKIILSKMLDTDISPLGFDANKMYHFVAAKFEQPSAQVQDQALHWLQVLTVLEITIPLSLLFNIFEIGVNVLIENFYPENTASQIMALKAAKTKYPSLLKIDSEETSPSTEVEQNLSCFILMLDLLLKQMELQDIDKHTGIESNLCKDVCRLLKCMVTAPWISNHICNSKNECTYCEYSIMWHQLSLNLIKYLSPVTPAHPPDPHIDEVSDEVVNRKSPMESEKKESKPDVVINMPIPDMHSVGGVLVHMPHVCSIMTATVETVSEQLDLAAIIPSEKVVSAVAQAITLTETDVGTATAQVSKPQIGGVDGETSCEPGAEELLDYWYTSLGKFRFTIEDLPQYLQYIYQLLNELPKSENPDILYYMLQVINILCLNGDAFTKASKEHRGFFIWAQENILIKSLWNLCSAEHSHICQVTVPLLLHCVTLPAGYDVFWKVIQESFHTSDWRVRFIAVERVTIIARFMDSTPLRSMMPLQAALANAFCYLISSIDDVNVYIAQRATLNIGTIHDTAIKSLVLCLETQFDTVIVDRPMVLQSLYQLHNTLSDRRILNWEFFLNRFDTLFLEAQINLEKSGEMSYLRDKEYFNLNLRNTDLNNEIFIRKLHRAHEALSQSNGSGTSSVKTLSASFGTKWPYKRTMSAPASMVPRHDGVRQEKEKVYSRQYSAPVLKRKSSRFGLDGHVHSFNTLEDSNIVGFLHKIIDLEEGDKETMHLLVFLLMQFLSRSDQAYPTDDKYLSKTQDIVLKHLYLLLGYSQSERGLYIPAQRLRVSPVFSAYLSNLPQLLDQNHLMGWILLNTSLTLLQYSPCPHSFTGNGHPPTLMYSLWALEPHSRHCWLMSLVVLLYKYQYNQAPQCQQLQALVRIVLNTLDAQHHHCRKIPATIVMGSTHPRLRNMSQSSLGPDEHSNDRMNTPPLSPMYLGDAQTQIHQVAFSSKSNKMQIATFQKPTSFTSTSMETHWEEVVHPDNKETQVQIQSQQLNNQKLQDYGLEIDDTESELIAIPESDLSDSTLYDSNQDSFDDHLDDFFGYKTPQPTSSIPTTDIKSYMQPQTSRTTVNTEIVPTYKDTCTSLVIASHVLPASPAVKETFDIFNKGVKTTSSSSSVLISEKPVPKNIDKSAIFNRRPTWFIGSLEDTVHTAQKGKWNKEDVKVLVTSASSLSNNLSTKKSLPLGAKHLTKKSIGDDYDIHGDSYTSCVGSSYSTIHKSCVKDTSTSWLPASDSSSDSASNHHCEKMTINQPLLPTPSVERLLPIGVSVTKFPSKQTEKVMSPDSPLSKMDVLSLGSSKDCDTDTNSITTPITTVGAGSQLNIPLQERLLPVGPHSKEINILVEKVKHALGITPQSTSTSLEMKTSKIYSRYSLKERSRFNQENHMSSSDELEMKSRPLSPRRLTKQIALESPPHMYDFEDRGIYKNSSYDRIADENILYAQRQRLAKSKNFTMHSQSPSKNPKHPGSWYGPPFVNFLDSEYQQTCHASIDLKQSSFRISDECVNDRCAECGMVIEQYSDEEIGLCIIILGTFIHREPALAAPMLPDILSIVAKLSLNAMYPWQNETNVHLPGGAISVAHQFIRCVLHQLAPNGIFIQMFQTQASDMARQQFFRSVAQALMDFNELNPIAPLQLLLESLNSKKTIPIETLPVIIENMACYLDCLPLEGGLGSILPLWNALLAQLEILFRRIVFLLHTLDDVIPLLRIMISILKIPSITQYKGILDPFSKVLGHAIQTQLLEYQHLVNLCILCNRAFNRERDKLILCRMIIFELIQALKFKTSIPDANFLMLINLVLQDSGGAIPSSIVLKHSQTSNSMDYLHVFGTNVADCMRLHLGDVLEFLTDFHTLNKIKSYCKGAAVGLNDDTLGGIIKSSLAQYLALEITRSNGRDNKAVSKYFPWLCNMSSSQLGNREFIDCIGHIRLLSWLLLGSLTHTAIYGNGNNNHHNMTSYCATQPIPQEASCQIADHIQIILAGFADQPKASVLHMSSLFHVFILCQLWTIYLEQGLTHVLPMAETYINMNILFDFWGKVTPCILQLISHSKMLSEMVSLHFLCMLEALLECRSTFLCKLLPLWTPVLYSHHVQLPGHLQVRLQNCRNYPALVNMQTLPNKNQLQVNNPTLLRWLQRLQFKMGQIELQSSTAIQFYSL